jgi:hypothetical protein
VQVQQPQQQQHQQQQHQQQPPEASKPPQPRPLAPPTPPLVYVVVRGLQRGVTPTAFANFAETYGSVVASAPSGAHVPIVDGDADGDGAASLLMGVGVGEGVVARGAGVIGDGSTGSGSGGSGGTTAGYIEYATEDAAADADDDTDRKYVAGLCVKPNVLWSASGASMQEAATTAAMKDLLGVISSCAESEKQRCAESVGEKERV